MTKQSQLKAVVFDFDGVIVDSEPLHYRSFLRIAEPLGKTFTWEEYLQTYIGFDDRDAFRVILGGKPGVPGTEAEEAQVIQMGLDKAKAFEAEVEAGIDPIPGVLELIDSIASRMPIAISSGATRFDIDLILGKLDLKDCFKIIVTADRVARSKPDPQSYALAVQELAQAHPQHGLEPSVCLAIEDTAAGIASAKGAGLMALGLAHGDSASLLHQANRVIDSFVGVNVDTLHEWFG